MIFTSQYILILDIEGAIILLRCVYKKPDRSGHQISSSVKPRYLYQIMAACYYKS
jgi:hypothetical protein